MDALKFQATVAQVKTMADGGLRLSLDLSEKEIETAASMMKAKQSGSLLEIAVVFINPESIVKQQENNAVQKRSEWQSQRQA